jgi:hypothetical protein
VYHAIEGGYLVWLFSRFTASDPRLVAAADQGFYPDFVARMATAKPAE